MSNGLSNKDAESFAKGVLTSAEEYRQKYQQSKPYKHAYVENLLNDELLKNARKEILEELQFTEKETDIYKINQTGDLANLDGLPIEESKCLENLLKVRNALYSSEFRSWLEIVTQCGPLSSKKKDMSINDYTSGCHLLNHDDVISTRRVSFILYLPDPNEQWNSNWGGGLELYSTQQPHIPDVKPSLNIPPKWNQFTFFAVQPGHSFHAVEEVIRSGKHRLSISGWFHRPQSDEQGYNQKDEEAEEQARKDHASAESLLSKKFDLPFISFSEEFQHLPGTTLSNQDIEYLSKFLNPAYLQSKTQSILFEKFGDESHILLQDFLKKDFAESLEKALLEMDNNDRIHWWKNGSQSKSKLIPTSYDLGESSNWKIIGPPHRERYLNCESTSQMNGDSNGDKIDATSLLLDIKTMLESSAWRRFLSNISQLIPISARSIRVRRFRPGLDYTLARSDSHAVLDVTLDVTPNIGKAMMKSLGSQANVPKGLAGKKKSSFANSTSGELRNLAKKLKSSWENGEVGGWQAYMPPVNDDDDPAVYASGKKVEEEEEQKQEIEEVEMINGDNQDENDKDEDLAELDEDEDEDDEEDDDSDVLLNLMAQFNTLSVVLRDEGVMKFVKYLSNSAGSSRFDFQLEYEIGAAIPIEEEE